MGRTVLLLLTVSSDLLDLGKVLLRLLNQLDRVTIRPKVISQPKIIDLPLEVPRSIFVVLEHFSVVFSGQEDFSPANGFGELLFRDKPTLGDVV